MREHETDVITTHGTFKQGELKNVEITRAKDKRKVKYCPIKRRPCVRNCALWTGTDCKLYTGGLLRSGGVCPVSGERCGESCAMFQNEKQCALFNN